VIQHITRAELLHYKETFYQPKNTVIGLAGKLPGNIRKLVEKYFEVNKSGAADCPAFIPFRAPQTKLRIKLHYKKTEQVQLALGFPGFSYSDPRVYALYLLSIILGGNMSSRLFTAVRERRGLAYFVRSYLNIYQDTGNIIIQSGLDKSRLLEAVKTINDELALVKRNGVTARELKQAKEFLRGKIVLTLEDSSNLADWFAKQEILQNQTLTPEEKLRLFDRVTLAEIKKVANEVFQNKLLNLVLIGPDRDPLVFEKLFTL
jgi:predicted Zn-dependent peptidase